MASDTHHESQARQAVDVYNARRPREISGRHEGNHHAPLRGMQGHARPDRRRATDLVRPTGGAEAPRSPVYAPEPDDYGEVSLRGRILIPVEERRIKALV